MRICVLLWNIEIKMIELESNSGDYMKEFDRMKAFIKTECIQDLLKVSYEVQLILPDDVHVEYVKIMSILMVYGLSGEQKSYDEWSKSRSSFIEASRKLIGTEQITKGMIRMVHGRHDLILRKLFDRTTTGTQAPWM